MSTSFCQMGVINLTPNSFSDGNQFLDVIDLEKKVDSFLRFPSLVFDFGAESTAPFNAPVSVKIEKERFEDFLFPLVLKNKFVKRTISIDTYRPETFLFVYEFFQKNSPESQLIWNDISGVIDCEGIDLLKNDCLNAHYVFSHQNNTDRYKASSHMERVVVGEGCEIINLLKDYFLEAGEKFLQSGVQNKIIFDPCFGFSKTLEQNLFLLSHLDKLIVDDLRDYQWLFGISRKSFLQKLLLKSYPFLVDKKEIFHGCDLLAASYYHKWAPLLNSLDCGGLIRVHDPLTFTL